MRERKLPVVFDYLDYRSFLNDYFDYRRNVSSISYRSFARRAGVSSPSFPKLVLDGERNLSTLMAPKFAAACELEGEAAEYFCQLVAYTQNPSDEALAELERYKKHRSLEPLELRHEAYYSKWYIPAVFEVVALEDFDGTPQWIAEHMVPPVTAEEAQHALDVLTELELVVRNEARFTQSANSVVMPGAVGKAMESTFADYLRVMAEHAHVSLVRDHDRFINVVTATLTVRAENLDELRARLDAFSSELLQWTAGHPRADQIVQLNTQLFPRCVSSGTREGSALDRAATDPPQPTDEQTPVSEKGAPVVYDFLDYRVFLSAYFQYRKSASSISYRSFARDAGVKSASFPKLVIDGQRNLSAEMAPMFALACGLKDDAAAYFCKLVEHTQHPREELLAELERLRKTKALYSLAAQHAMLYSKWFIPAVLEAVLLEGCDDTPEWIAGHLVPAISVDEASEALDTLLKLGLLVRTEVGLQRNTPATYIATEESSQIEDIFARYLQVLAQHGRDAIGRAENGHLVVETVTIPIDSRRTAELKDRMNQLSYELIRWSSALPNPDRVVQLNIQLFPRTRLALKRED